MRLYQDLAEWWHIFSDPEDYAEEANLYWDIISRYKKDISLALELGAGGGNNALHLKKRCSWVLTDLSPTMLAQSQKLNPDCEHHVADMRNLDLNRQFDLIFIHDAIMFITSKKDLLAVFKTARKHLKEDGLLFIAPDFFQETFKPSTDCGGEDEEGRSVRYLEWMYDTNPHDNLVEVEYTYLLKEGVKETVLIHEKVEEGLFSKQTWQDLLQEAGFSTNFEVINHSELSPGSYIGIVGQII